MTLTSMSSPACCQIPARKRTPRKVRPDWELLRQLGLAPRGREARVVQLPMSVRQALRAPKPLLPSEWAERHFWVVEGSRKGPWRNKNAPYLAGIMDTFVEPYVEEIVTMAVPQIGKSKMVEILIATIADQFPAPTQYIHPDELSARDVANDRLLPLFQRQRRLARYLTGRSQDLSAKGLRLNHMMIGLPWAGSPARLAMVAVKYQFYGELDKWPVRLKREAGPQALAEKRQRTYRFGRKRFKESTPTTPDGHIAVAFGACAAKFVYRVACPRCDYMQEMYSKNEAGRKGLRFPKWLRDPEAARRDGAPIWYECELCGDRWDDARRDQAVQRGGWFEAETGMERLAYLEAYRPRTVGFHLSAFFSPFVPLGEIAAAIIEISKLEGVKKLERTRDFYNSILGLPFQDHEKQREEHRILALRDRRDISKGDAPVPGGGQVCALIGAGDTQTEGYWYEVRAAGWGPSCTTWGLRRGYVRHKHDLLDIVTKAYRDDDGLRYQLPWFPLDWQGDRQKEIRDLYYESNGFVIPVQGRWGKHLTSLYNWTKMSDGTPLLQINVNAYKHQLARILMIDLMDPGSWRYDMELTVDWARQMCAEYVDDRGQWVCPEHLANHGWDVSVYELCMLDILGLRFTERPASTAAPSTPPTQVRESVAAEDPRDGVLY